MVYIHREICSCCGFRIPKEDDAEVGKQIPCSPYHERCIRCAWPVAKTLINPQGLCFKCMSGDERRAYNRKSGRLLYGAVDGSTDPKDYLMNGRMTFHGDEERVLEKRRNRKRTMPPIDEERLKNNICQLPSCTNVNRTPGARYCSHPHSLEHRWQDHKSEEEVHDAHVTKSAH